MPSQHAEAVQTPHYEDASGDALSLEQVAARLAGARVVYVGERHDRASDHAMEDAIAGALGPRAVGLEMFQRPAQGALDRYDAGTLDEAGLLEETQWARRWGFDFGFYRPLLERARRDGSPIVALNATSELVRTISTGGLASLPDGQRAALPALDLGVASHRARFDAAMGDHPDLPPDRVARFYEAQVVWDETMAKSVAHYLSRPGARPMLVVAGEMHVRRDAIPERAARRGAAPYAIVLPVDASDLQADRPDADVLAVFGSR